jgi:hypothetical protein
MHRLRAQAVRLAPISFREAAGTVREVWRGWVSNLPKNLPEGHDVLEQMRQLRRGRRQRGEVQPVQFVQVGAHLRQIAQRRVVARQLGRPQQSAAE